MFKHFLKITFRNMIKNKFYVIINVVGLGIGLACVIVGYSIFKFESDFDSFHTNRDVIYKINVTKNVNGFNQPSGMTPTSLGPAIKNSLSGIDNVVRFTANRTSIRYGENIFKKIVGFAENDFFEVFDLPMIYGDKNSIKDKNNIIISEKVAGILFGEKNPMGKLITLYPYNSKENHVLKISGVFKELPENSSLQFEALSTIENYFEFFNVEEHSWKTWVYATFLKVSDKERIPLINEQLKAFVEIQNDARKDWLIESYYTERFKDIPYTENIINNRLRNGIGSIGYIFVTVLVSIILLLACFNFTNTFLAISNGRLKEIGINKVLGGIRRFTIIQFLGENIILCLIALFLALTIAPFFLEAWNSFLGMNITMEFASSLGFWIFLVGLLFFTAFLAGAYPSFYISKFNPVNILKGSAHYKAGGWVSKMLLTLQFLLATVGNVAAVLFIQNSYYQDDLYLGYNKEQVIVVRVADNSSLFELKNKISQNPFISKIGVTDDWVQGGGWYPRPLKNGEQQHDVQVFDVGRGYFETMEFQLKEGRHFDQDAQESERGKAVIVNEKLVRDYGWKSAIGQRLKLNDSTEFNVIGVVKNFNIDGFIDKLEPTIFKLGMQEQMDVIVVNTNIENLEMVNNYIKEEWAEIIPNEPYSGTFMSDELAHTNEPVKPLIRIFLFIGTISVLLSMVGLYSLVSLNIIKKTKEIGIRKVFGAPIFNLLKLINKQFIYIVLMGSVLGSVIGAALSLALMDEAFAYHIGFNILSLLVPVLSILIISVVLISKKVYNAANLNPVDSLKYE